MKQAFQVSLMMFLVVGLWYSVGYMQGFTDGERLATRSTDGENGSVDSDE